MQRRALIVAGGTGGHIFPALAVADALRARGVEVVWLGAEGGMEAGLVARAGIPFTAVKVKGIRGKGWSSLLQAPLNILRATAASLRAILSLRPDIVLGMGGFVSGPCGIAAWLCRIPLIIHEQNSIPGITNRVLSAIATRTLMAYAGSFAPGRRRLVTGNPLRASIAALASLQTPRAPGPPRVLVLGGSLGARTLNRAVPAVLARLAPTSAFEVLHQTGARELEDTRAAYDSAGVCARVESFIDDMATTYRWADIVICRAGALTLAEVCAAHLPAVLIPYPHAVDDHQTFNARGMVERGAALLVPDAPIDQTRLLEAVQTLLTDEGVRVAMGASAGRLARPDASLAVVECCLEHARVRT